MCLILVKFLTMPPVFRFRSPPGPSPGSTVNVCSSHDISVQLFNPLNAELNPICHLLALLGAHHILHVSWIRVNIRYRQEIFTRPCALLFLSRHRIFHNQHKEL
jgi:hypothetical protein